jgi:hypothetical protein
VQWDRPNSKLAGARAARFAYRHASARLVNEFLRTRHEAEKFAGLTASAWLFVPVLAAGDFLIRLITQNF